MAEDVLAPFVTYFLHHHYPDLHRILASPSPDQHFPVNIGMAKLADADPALAEELLANPKAMMTAADAGLGRALEAVRKGHGDTTLTLKDNVHARFSGFLLGGSSASAKELSPPISTIGSAHLDRLLTICGSVVRTGTIKLFEARRLYECTKLVATLQLIRMQVYPPKRRQMFFSGCAQLFTHSPIAQVSASICGNSRPGGRRNGAATDQLPLQTAASVPGNLLQVQGVR
jgi:hypothetical protein